MPASMSDFDPTPLLTGVGTGVGAGLLGFLGGRRQSKAQAALTEVQAAKAAVDVLRESMTHLSAEVAELRSEVRSLRVTRHSHGVLVEYVDSAWRAYDEGRPVPYDRPPHIVAIVRPEVAEALTGEVPVIGEHIDDRRETDR